MKPNFGFTFGRTPESQSQEYQELVKRLEEQAKTQTTTPDVQEPPLNTQNSNSQPQTRNNNFIYVPSINLSFSDSRLLLNKNWDETNDELRNQGLFMPTPSQFREFLKSLRDSKDANYKALYKDITEVRSPWRSNWLNAKFEKRKNGMYTHSKNILENGKYKDVEQKITDFLSKDRTPGISLDSWLDSNTPHGLPPANVPQGDLYYWYPREGNVAGFVAVSGRAYLVCDGDPSYRFASLGVFACAEGARSKNKGGKR